MLGPAFLHCKSGFREGFFKRVPFVKKRQVDYLSLQRFGSSPNVSSFPAENIGMVHGLLKSL